MVLLFSWCHAKTCGPLQKETFDGCGLFPAELLGAGFADRRWRRQCRVVGEPVQPFQTSPSGAPRYKMSGKRSPFGVKRSATELMQ